MRQVEQTLPEGVRIQPIYDRSELVRSSIRGLRATIVEVTITVVVVILAFLGLLAERARRACEHCAGGADLRSFRSRGSVSTRM